MSQQPSSKTDRHAAPARPLLSHTSILIFSSFLVGLLGTRMLPAATDPLLFTAAVVGIISWCGLGQLSERRQRAQARQARREASREMDRRIARHVSRQERDRLAQPTLPTALMHSQFMAVARSRPNS